MIMKERHYKCPCGDLGLFTERHAGVSLFMARSQLTVSDWTEIGDWEIFNEFGGNILRHSTEASSPGWKWRDFGERMEELL